MKALVYLLVIQLKNRILSLKKKPAYLILYGLVFLIIVASLLFLIFFQGDMEQTSFSDERILFLILSGLGMFFLYAFTYSGLSTGSSLFTMPDVGLLFVSPISSKKILMYGLLSTMGKALLGSIFIFYQITNLRQNFGYGMKEIFALFLIFALMTIFGQLLAIGIYIFSNGNTNRKNIVKALLYTTFIIVILSVLLIQRQNQVGMFEAVLRVVDSAWFGYIPVAGWATMFFIGIVRNSIIAVILSLALFLVTGVFIILLLTAGKADYYEDVLLSTEVTYQTRQAAKEGRNIPRQSNKKIKIKDHEQGIRNGFGAMTIMYKHILELRRKSKLVFIDKYTIGMMVLVAIIGYNFKLRNAPQGVNYIVIAVAIYFQYFLTLMGKLKMELTKPYIYLIPARSIVKVLAASATSLLKPCLDGLLIFAAFAVFSGANVLSCLFFALAYAASGAVFVGMTILYQRVLGDQPNLLIQTMIFLGLLIIIMGPSIGATVVAALLLPQGLAFLSMLPYTGFCLLFAALLFFLNGNLIDKAEFTGK